MREANEALWREAKTLILLILKEQHPKPMKREALKARCSQLIEEHGNIFAACEYMRRQLCQ
jgi:hypothetical protein